MQKQDECFHEKIISDSGLCIPSIAERQGMKRGWFTYTDLCVLLEQSAWSQALTAIYQHFTKVRGGFKLNGAERIFICLGCFRGLFCLSFFPCLLFLFSIYNLRPHKTCKNNKF